MRSLVASLLLFAGGCSYGFASTPSKKDALKLAQHALDRSNIRSPGSVPFRLRIRYTLHEEAGGTAEGSYVLNWASPDRWKEDIRLGDYWQTRVAGPSKRWIKRSLDYEPLQVREARSVFFRSEPGIHPKERVRGVHKAKELGEGTFCLWLDSKTFVPRELCFDQAGRLVREKWHRAVLEYSHYVGFSSKLFPTRIRAELPSRLDLEAWVDELVQEPGPPTSSFMPPPDSEEWDWCEHMKSAKWLDGPMPNHERLAYKYLAGDSSAEVTISSVIGTDGRLHDFQVLQTGGKALDEASIEVMKKWRYNPAYCGERAVRSELLMTFSYQHEKLTSDCGWTIGLPCP